MDLLHLIVLVWVSWALARLDNALGSVTNLLVHLHGTHKLRLSSSKSLSTVKLLVNSIIWNEIASGFLTLSMIANKCSVLVNFQTRSGLGVSLGWVARLQIHIERWQANHLSLLLEFGDITNLKVDDLIVWLVLCRISIELLHLQREKFSVIDLVVILGPWRIQALKVIICDAATSWWLHVDNAVILYYRLNFLSLLLGYC